MQAECNQACLNCRGAAENRSEFLSEAIENEPLFSVSVETLVSKLAANLRHFFLSTKKISLQKIYIFPNFVPKNPTFVTFCPFHRK